jgi:hypothetical protein
MKHWSTKGRAISPGPNPHRHFDARDEGWTKVVLDGPR